MSHTLKASVLAVLLAGALPAGSALAQSYTAPAGIPAETAPGAAVTPGAARGWNQAAPGAVDAATTGSVGGRVHQGKPVRR